MSGRRDKTQTRHQHLKHAASHAVKPPLNRAPRQVRFANIEGRVCQSMNLVRTTPNPGSDGTKLGSKLIPAVQESGFTLQPSRLCLTTNPVPSGPNPVRTRTNQGSRKTKPSSRNAKVGFPVVKVGSPDVKSGYPRTRGPDSAAAGGAATCATMELVADAKTPAVAAQELLQEAIFILRATLTGEKSPKVQQQATALLAVLEAPAGPLTLEAYGKFVCWFCTEETAGSSDGAFSAFELRLLAHCALR